MAEHNGYSGLLSYHVFFKPFDGIDSCHRIVNVVILCGIDSCHHIVNVVILCGIDWMIIAKKWHNAAFVKSQLCHTMYDKNEYM